jgi:protein-S-isoprenylcysteine O-methyltransferase Ste14
MFEPLAVTLLPALFLAVLIGGGEVFRRQRINQDGKPPIDRRVFYASKYAIVVLWGAVIASSWGAPVSFVDVPSASKWVGLLFWAAGFLVLFVGRFGLGKSFRIGSPTEQTDLRVNGLFRLSRNPMYLGVYATLVASVFYTLNPIMLVVAAFVVVAHHRIVLAEERHLTNAFGSKYADYCRCVRRYL